MANIIHKRTKNNKGALKRALAVGEIGIVYGDDTAYFIVKDENGHVYEFVPDQNEVVVRSYIRLTVDDIEYNETPHPTATFINVTNLGNEIIDNNAEFTFTYKEEDCDNGTLLTDFTYNNEDTSRTICCTCESQGIITSITFNQSPVKFCIRYDSIYMSCDLDYPILINSETEQYIHISTNNCFTSEQAKNIHEIQFGSNSDYNICLSRLYLNLYPTHYLTSMSRMFSQCYNLTYLNLGKFDTSNVTSMTNMFYYCYKLTSLDVSNFDTSKVTDMSSMFYLCSSLTSLDLSNFDTSKVTYMGYMFYNCSSLSSLTLSNFDTSKVTYMGYMFYNCRSLSSLTLSNFDTSNVTDMYSMFQYCSSIKSLDLNNWDTSKVTNMGYMFRDCRSLTSLDLSNFDTNSVTYMGHMFYLCSSLTSLDLSNFDTSNVTDMAYMFYLCSSLTSLDLSNFDTSNVTDMAYMFYNCRSLSSLTLSNFDTSNVTYMGYMFYNCRSLSSLTLSNFDTSNVTYMNQMFEDCHNLEQIDLHLCNTCNLKYCSSMFKNCSSLTFIDLSTFSSIHIEASYNMFDGCPDSFSIRTNNSFKEFLINNKNTNGLLNKNITWIDSEIAPMCSYFIATTTGGTYSYRKNDSDVITNVKSGEIVEASTQWTTCKGMFSSQTNIETIDMSNLENISSTRTLSTHSMFRECPNLTTVIAPTLYKSNTAMGMFRDSSSLTYIDIRNLTITYGGSEYFRMFDNIGPNATIIVNRTFWEWIHNFDGGSELTRTNVSSATFKYGDGDDDIWTWPIS